MCRWKRVWRLEIIACAFGAPCDPVRVGFTPDCFVSGEESPVPLKEGYTLPLTHDLFDQDALVLRGMSVQGGHSVTVAYPDLPYLGIWHRPKTDASYVCIEPWVSLPAKHGEIAQFEKRDNLIFLESGKTCTNRWAIAIGE